MMIRRRSFVLAAASVLAIPVSAAEAPLANFRFGILRTIADGEIDFLRETTRRDAGRA